MISEPIDIGGFLTLKVLCPTDKLLLLLLIMLTLNL